MTQSLIHIHVHVASVNEITTPCCSVGVVTKWNINFELLLCELLLCILWPHHSVYTVNPAYNYIT